KVVTAMHSSGRFQLKVGKRLNPEANSIYSSSGPGSGFFGRHRFGVSLQRDFFPFARKRSPNFVQNILQMDGIKQTRRSAAKINTRAQNGSSDGVGPDSGGSKKATMIGYFLLNCLRVRRVFSRRNNSRVEIAVSAFRLAERHLNVDSEIHCATHDFSTAGMA